MPTIEFLKHLNRKLKTGNLRSIHLNALPGRYATRLDLHKLNVIKGQLAADFLKTLLQEPSFKFTISFDRINLNEIDEDTQNELNFVAKKLNSIYYQNNDNYLEHGIKTFLFGYPIIIKRNKQDPSKIIKAPLIIWHLDIVKSTRKTNEWKIIRDEDSPVTLNEVLISHIEQDEEITIQELSSEYLEDGIIDNEEIIQICNEVLEQLNVTDNKNLSVQISSCPNREKVENITGNIPWISWAGIFGLYRAQKESIITELDKLIENYESFELENLKVETYQTSTITGVETDPSQEEIINSLTKKPARIIQGPPGTGKSQSLTAIITNALENGAKCLVVCEKKTALDVIYNNLSDLGFGGLCAVIDDVSRDRKKIIDKVRTVVDEVKYHHVSFRENEYRSKLSHYKQLRQEINKKHKSVLKKIFGDDKWKDVIGRYLSKEKIESKEAIQSQLNKNEFQFNYEEYQELSKIVKDGKFLFREINTLNHPLDKLNDNIFQGPYLNSSKIETEDILKSLDRLCDTLIDNYQYNIELFGERFSENSSFNRSMISFLTIFSTNYKKIKEARINFISQYQNFIVQHKKYNHFKFAFVEGELKNYSIIQHNLEFYQKKIKGLLAAFSAFQEFFEWKSFFLKLEQNQRSLIIALIKSDVVDWENVFESWYYNCILSKYESELGPFHQNDRLIIELSNLNQSLKQMQRNKITDLWAKQQQTSIMRFKTQTGNINSLYNYKKNKQYGRKNSLRKIIHTDFDLFTDFFPVVMVNPVVSSSILPLKEGLFDMIIFDEASQLRLEDTYTAYIRGKYKIISGDVHQMPPSNYFGKEIALDIDEDDEDLEDETNGIMDDSLEMADKESLLQYGVDSGFDKSYLDFHYRSRHPYLIDFSNAAFYGSRLTPMPERHTYKPIRLFQVNGLYEKNRTNPAEAKAIINILFNHIHPKENGDYPSIGIATFNIDQRNLILEMIQDECFLEKEKNNKYEKLKESGLFVKNLENIQGDERDIIIISTTFGLNSEGKFRQNFGPINQLKGYKLLNVIITRAKYKLYLCTSIPADYYNRYREEITTRGNVGKAIFYAYLAYARAIEEGNNEERESILKLLQEHCSGIEPSKSVDFVESPFEQEVYDYLIDYIDKERIEIQYKIGGFRIDFVVRSKVNGKPIIAIECDGAYYHNTEEAYAHDMYRQKIIERNIGINFYRIWSTNWWVAPQKEIQKLVKFIEFIDAKDEKTSMKDEQSPYKEGLKFSDEALRSLLGNGEPLEQSVKKETENPIVTLNSTVIIRNIQEGKEMTVNFTTDKSKVDINSTSKKVIYNESPLAKSLLKKTVGEKFKINGIEVYYEVLDIMN